MSWSRLVCAACSGLVVEGRCPTCRRARAQLQGDGLTVALVWCLAALAAVLVLLAGTLLVTRATA